jgi:hypothetical protein
MMPWRTVFEAAPSMPLAPSNRMPPDWYPVTTLLSTVT